MSGEYKVTQEPPCVACGGVAHGSVNVRINCLMHALVKSRIVEATQATELAKASARVRDPRIFQIQRGAYRACPRARS